MEIKIKYHDPDIAHLGLEQHGDWIDLRSAENCFIEPGEFKIISLGVSMKLPEGYEAHVCPRSSTFRNFGLLQANSMGIIDEAYCGEDDIWGFPAYSPKGSIIRKGDRICQFRIMKKMEPVTFTEVDHMEDESRGGFGSTGM